MIVFASIWRKWLSFFNNLTLHHFVLTFYNTADLQDMDKFGNHFLLAAASLGSQLLKPYDTSLENIADFFFKILIGKVDIQQISGEFSMRELVDKFK